MANIPSYTTVMRAMRALADHEAKVTLAHGSNTTTLGVIRLDNVQNYLFQRDNAVGRENRLNIGLAATYYEVDLGDIDIKIFSLDAKREVKARGLRQKLDVQSLLGFIDNQHLESVFSLHWILVLVQRIPELSHLLSDVELLFRTRVAKQRLRLSQSKIHPLASSSRSETVLTEFKEALEDFFAQTGQTHESFKRYLFPIGGDGLTYEKMIQLQEYLQLHESEFDSFEFMQPLLEWWHTEWTNLSRLCEFHWGSDGPEALDPSTLGHSAAKIGWKKPPNLKKVDFYTTADLVDTVLDGRMLDCWR